MKLNGLYPIICLLSVWNFAFSAKHCPALSLDFADFGIPYCSPSFLYANPEDAVKEILQAIKCSGYGEWTLPASVGCSSPVLTEGLEMKFPCGCDFGSKCTVKCNHDYRLIGDETVVCLPSGSYSTLPKCERKTCFAPELPQNVKLASNCPYEEGSNCSVSCISSAYKMHGKSSIACDHGRWTEFPICRRFCLLSKIPSNLKVPSACEGEENEFCTVTCQNARLKLNGAEAIQCLISGEWSIFPTCGCTKGTVPHSLKLSGTCRMLAGEYCDAECDPKYYQKGNNRRIFCDANGKWDAAPSRSIQCWKKCDEPRLSTGLAFVTPCLRATVGEECRVKCSDGSMKLVGSNIFHCLQIGVYSEIAACTESQKCSRSLVSKTVTFAHNCLNIVGETCSISCAKPNSVLVGPTSITCLASGAWDKSVECVLYCPPFPKVPQYQPTDCRLVRENANCDVKCRPGYTPLSTQHVKCLEGGRWPDEMPKCFADCGFPPAGHNVIIDQPCTGTENDTCAVRCNGEGLNLRPKGISVITCLPNGQWSHKPECIRGCNMNLPQGITFASTCSLPLALDEVCEARCEKEARGLRNNKVKCTARGFKIDEVSRRPTTPYCLPFCKDPPSLPPYLEFVGLCKNLFFGDKCEVKCRDPRYTLSKFLVCVGARSIQWASMPKCIINCPPPNLPFGTTIEGSCSFENNKPCKQVCRDKAEVFPGMKTEHLITCLDGLWSPSQTCFMLCTPPVFPPDSQPGLQCDRMLGSVCVIKCIYQHEIVGSPTITCTKSGWTRMPQCVVFCILPAYPPHMIHATNCSTFVNNPCKLMCYGNTRLVGPDTMYCVPVNDPRKAAYTQLGECVPNF